MCAQTISVLGSANMDLVVTADRVPALGETVPGREFVQGPGGKGANQALAAARAGARVRMLGAVGDDAFGAAVRSVLRADGVDTEGLRTVPGSTGTAHVTVDGAGANSIVVVPGANGTVRALDDAHRAVIADSDTLLLQLELPSGVVAEAASWARGHGTRVVLTPAPVAPLPGTLLGDVDVLVPNEHEAAGLAGPAEPGAVARELRARGPSVVVVTLGAQGCVVAGEDGSTTRVGAPAVTAVDTTAAGDTFVGYLAAALGGGRPLHEAVRWATAAAALSVQRVGASSSMPSRTEVDEAHAAATHGC
jgi:ribokinase